MSAVRNRQATEQWITPPEPALNRYLIGSCRRAVNDNRGFSSKHLLILQISACLTLSGVLTLLAAFTH
jgi:hypothetical protein